MVIHEENKIFKLRVIFLLTSFLSLFFGIFIYLFLRDISSMKVLNWLEFLHLQELILTLREQFLVSKLKEFDGIYVVPDFLWAFSFTLVLLVIWLNDEKYKYFFIAVPCFIGVLSEIMQYLNFISGTFDVFDLIAYLTAYILVIFFNLLITKY